VRKRAGVVPRSLVVHAELELTFGRWRRVALTVRGRRKKTDSKSKQQGPPKSGRPCPTALD
jgi:hypothetical protein